VRYASCSNTTTWQFEEASNVSHANGFAAYRCVQQRRTYLRPKPSVDFSPPVSISDELLNHCETRGGFTLLASSPLFEVAYAREGRPIPKHYSGPDTDARLAALERVVPEAGRRRSSGCSPGW
jgi:hypothetical protein